MGPQIHADLGLKMEHGFHGFDTDGHGFLEDADTRRLNGFSRMGIVSPTFTRRGAVSNELGGLTRMEFQA